MALMWVIGNGQQEPDVMQLLTGFSIQKSNWKNWRKGIYRKWIPEFELGYSEPMVEHAMAR
jgi:hypothetical protein